MIHQHLSKSINEASKVIGKTWPLYSFVTSNPLSGYEKLPFRDAISNAKDLLNARVYPETTMFRQAYDFGEIEKEVVVSLLKEQGLTDAPEFYLELLESKKGKEEKNVNHNLDRIMAKWLAAFLDEGLAEWDMPGKTDGFYRAWRRLAIYDNELGSFNKKELPKTSDKALADIMSAYPTEIYTKIFAFHLAALPGWTGYINYRVESNSLWQQKYPISLEEYLAVRLWVAKQIGAQILPNKKETETDQLIETIQYVWLKAWEKSWQNQLTKTLLDDAPHIVSEQKEQKALAAQMVFCIDTRSEQIRRHVEAQGNYETFGYAGFFGIAMDYENLDDGVTRKACPPIVSSAYTVSETHQPKKDKDLASHQQKNEFLKFGQYFLKRMKNMLPSAFGYVEGSGFFYGLSLLARTLAPNRLYNFKKNNTVSYETICEPEIHTAQAKDEFSDTIPLNEKVAIVKSAFDLTGWNKFAPLVLFVGHGSHTANNPFGSSLDCGACAASPGRHNARMLAKLANQPMVRKSLAEEFGIVIPKSTLFIGAEHNTTTDEIILFDSNLPSSHEERLLQLKVDLLKIQQSATQNRLGVTKNSIAAAHKKANNWGETRPEWGLAKNAGFIVGPRELTKNKNLDSRCFLHSYEWESDVSGEALEGIMQGPMVVTQWINNHYYFTSVDNNTFGGGSKITHNITGKFGVVQGNGGDLKMGLPLESLQQTDDEFYHKPLRLSVVIQAPESMVNGIIARNENLKELLDNEWIYLMVMDPLQQNEMLRYKGNMEWDFVTERTVIEKSYEKEEEDVNNLEAVFA